MKILENAFDYDKINQIGLTNELKAIFTVNRFKIKNESILFVCSSLYEANMFYGLISNYTDDCLLFPMDDFLTSQALAISPELKTTRLETINTLLTNNKKIVITNLMGFLRYLPSVKNYQNSIKKIKTNDTINLQELISFLDDNGYERQTIVGKTGEYAPRGYVLDIFPVSSKEPIRIELWGDTIDSIKTFNIDNQLTIASLDEMIILPNSEFSTNIQDDTNYNSIINYLENPCILYNNYDEVLNNYNLLTEEILEFNESTNQNKKYMFELNELLNKNSLYFYNMNKDKDDKVYNSSNIDIFSKVPLEIGEKINKYLKNNTVIICLSNKYLMNKIIENITNVSFAMTNEDEIYKGKANLIVKKITKSFKLDNFVVISENDIFNYKTQNHVYKTNFKIGSKIRDISKLNIGDYIVHQINGIGKYCGIKTLEKMGIKKDYLLLEYAGGDKLYVPVEKIDIINKYSNADSIVPKLSKLGSNEFSKIKLKVKAKVQIMAHDLLSLYAKREVSKGFKFLKDDENQVLFEQEFPFTETPDQLKAIEDIKRDMEKETPMDRLLCGDVGFGKTEVAFRAIFKAILSHKQAAILCPTTILSDQHYKNALERFKSFPVNIAILNRFVSSKKTKETLNDLKQGKIDLIIGTHKLLGKDVVFKDLGLLVIDEEQRFGVTHKEKIKKYKESIDVLTLSATPIPRTLQMSLSGIRGLSLIETPPVNRYPIQTYVLEENNQIIKDAIYKELSRNGQVFILYNYIDGMDSKKIELEKLAPDAKIEIIHGGMDKEKLEKVMLDFINKEFDCLLCTTIIETGIDIPNVNTLIIYDADKYGLSQLYQIRGRVGRSERIAYCYLMYNKSKILSDVATKRLSAIKDFTELGSGLSIAMRDLSIRGAGDILGAEQAGFIASVGMEMFMSMLNDEVNRLNGKEVKEISKKDEQPLLDVETYIPDEYVDNEELKIEIHKKINLIASKEMLDKISKELEDRFGKIPDSVIIYMYEEWFEKMAKNLEIDKVTQTKNYIEITIPEDISLLLNYNDLFIESQKISKNIRFKIKDQNLIVILDLNNLDKHYIYYLIDLILLIESKLK